MVPHNYQQSTEAKSIHFDSGRSQNSPTHSNSDIPNPNHPASEGTGHTKITHRCWMKVTNTDNQIPECCETQYQKVPLSNTEEEFHSLDPDNDDYLYDTNVIASGQYQETTINDLIASLERNDNTCSVLMNLYEALNMSIADTQYQTYASILTEKTGWQEINTMINIMQAKTASESINSVDRVKRASMLVYLGEVAKHYTTVSELINAFDGGDGHDSEPMLCRTYPAQLLREHFSPPPDKVAPAADQQHHQTQSADPLNDEGFSEQDDEDNFYSCNESVQKEFQVSPLNNP